jgi:peptide deformylase
MVLDVVIYPDGRLETECTPIEEVTESIQQLAKDMIETMYVHDGIGLAANQVGHMIRMLIVDISDERNSPLTLINPKIVSATGKISIKEGCLSFPDQEVEVIRSSEVLVEALSIDDMPVRIKAQGLAAIVLQHEMDHLDGVTMEARAAMQEVKE